MSTRVLTGHCLDVLPTLAADSVQTCVTSPPYYQLRSYKTEPQVWGGDGRCGDAHEWYADERRIPGGGYSAKSTLAGFTNPETKGRRMNAADMARSASCDRCGAWKGELGQESTPEAYVAHLVEVFRAVRRVLRPDGVLMVNIGDSYAGSGKGTPGPNAAIPHNERQGFTTSGAHFRPEGYKAKDIYGIPWMLAFALRADGWYLRGDYIWAKKSPMPESVRDRCTRSHEYVFHLTKSARYFWDADAIREPGVTTPERAATKWAARRNGTDKGQQEGIYHAGQDTAFRNDPNPLGANKRSVWTINTAGYSSGDQDTDHYAVMPDELAETCIKATTSQAGCCAMCGAPWRRVVEREAQFRPRPDGAKRVRNRGGRSDGLTKMPNGVAGVASTTTGWQPTCAHDAPVVPCTILDPFSGAGTTVLAADRLGRHGVGIELNANYAALATKRVYEDAPLLAAIEGAA